MGVNAGSRCTCHPPAPGPRLNLGSLGFLPASSTAPWPSSHPQLPFGCIHSVQCTFKISSHLNFIIAPQKSK